MIDGNSEKMYRHFQVNTLGRKNSADIGPWGISGCRHIASNILIYNLNIAKQVRSEAEIAVPFKTLLDKAKDYKRRTVILGGYILQTENLASETILKFTAGTAP